MDISYQYSKPRGSFGRQPMFCERGPELCDSIPVDVAEHKNFILRNPVHAGVQHAPARRRHLVNTARAEYASSGCHHAEGGWPRDVNVHDPETTQRYRRKVEKDEGYVHCVMSLAGGVEHLVLQNNAVDMYQAYYAELPPAPDVERASCRTVGVFRDGARRPVGSVCWRPDGGHAFAVTYADVDFDRRPRGPLDAFVWDAESANAPQSTLTPPHALLDLQYNPRHAELLAGGALNGQVVAWDLRASGAQPCAACPPHAAHRDLVRCVRFVNAKNGMELFSSGPDGVCKWWDLRKLSDPIDEMIVDFVASTGDRPSAARAHGVSYLEFEPTIPTKFMAGTEDGLVVTANRKGKTAFDKLPGKVAAHLGPVWKVERNPAFMKNFLTVGDWTARVWSEECRESAALWTPAQRHRVRDGAWSPTRMSLLLLAQQDGRLALWDLLRSQRAPVLAPRVCREPLHCVRPHEAGALAACGSAGGRVFLLELSRGLSESGERDKALLTAVLERESRRERILEARLREIRLRARAPGERSPGRAASAAELDAALGDRDLHDAAAEFHLVARRELAAT